MIEESLAGGWPTGEYRDVLLDEHGKPVWVRDWQRNLIVDNLRKVLAALMKGDTQAGKLGYWTVGSGDPAWDSGSLPTDTARRTRTQLYAETGRKVINPSQITFVGGTFTNKIEVSADFVVNDLTGTGGALSLREFGLFAGGTAAVNTGQLINHRIHPRIDMQSGFTLQRTLRLTF